MTNEEREAEALGDKLEECPLCNSDREEGCELCFHCEDCGYLQCADYDGTYNRETNA